MEPQATSPLNLFLSYCDRDEALKNDLCAHLAALERQKKIRLWQGEIDAGVERDGAIAHQL